MNSLKALNGLLDMELKVYDKNNLKVLSGLVVVVVDSRKHRVEGMAHKDRDEEGSVDLKVDNHNLEEEDSVDLKVDIHNLEEEVGGGMDMDCCKGMETRDHYPFFQQSNIKRKKPRDSLKRERLLLAKHAKQISKIQAFSPFLDQNLDQNSLNKRREGEKSPKIKEQ